MLADSTSEGVVISDQGVIVDCNRRFAEIFGAAREQCVGRSIMEFMVPEEEALIMERLRAGAEFVESRARRLDGTVIWVEARGRNFRRDGRELRIDALRDVTDRRRMDNELRRLSRAVEQSPATVVITGKEDRDTSQANFFQKLAMRLREFG